ncbi:hypothetical protein BDN72DRAFT_222801 [Pluteus cervinus]|nr:hypothetical protein BDN72DRAFT_222801 [Pluteus cervinus]
MSQSGYSRCPSPQPPCHLSLSSLVLTSISDPSSSSPHVPPPSPTHSSPLLLPLLPFSPRFNLPHTARRALPSPMFLIHSDRQQGAIRRAALIATDLQ